MSSEYSQEELKELVVAWQDWWQAYGHLFYKNADMFFEACQLGGKTIQEAKPPMLKYNDPLYTKWVQK
jgi:hypothetical protein